MKSWKKKWKEQLNDLVPPLDDNIKNMPIDSAPQTNGNGKNTLTLSKKATTVTVCIVIACLVIATVLACTLTLNKNTPIEQYVFTVEINPSITVVTDKSGNVMSITSSNNDADVILSDKEAVSAMIGKPFAELVSWYAERAGILGYLDVTETGSAVRISACEQGENLLQTASECLQAYFIDKGIYAVVITEKVDMDEFSKRSGIKSDSLESLAKLITGTPALLNERLAQNTDNVQKLYEQNILSDTLLKVVENFISDNLQLIEKNIVELKNIFQLYWQILTHEDNPGESLWNMDDYWDIKENYADKVSGELAEIMTQMDEALAQYETDFGIKIESTSQFSDLIKNYGDLLTLNSIDSLLNNFSAEVLIEYCKSFADIFEIIGDDKISGLLILPENKQEFTDKLTAALSLEFAHRKDLFENEFNRLQSISEEDYDAFVNNILSEYGSLENYWQSIK